MNWYSINNIETLDTPALVVYPELVKENIRILKTFVPDMNKVRPHMKTNKSAEVATMLMQEGITKFKCATIAEAEMLASVDAADVLLAYQPVGPKAIRLAELVEKFPSTQFSCLIDNLDTAKQISATFSERKLKINVLIDLNVGMNRTGILPGNAFDLFRECFSLTGITFTGLHAYDGHLRDIDFEERTRKCNEGFEAVNVLREKIHMMAGKNIVVVAGGTPTFPIHAKRKGVECSPGTFIYWDKGYQSILQEQPFLFAALVVTRIVSKPTDEIICIDLGHKSIASENTLQNRVTFLNAPDLQPIGHSEEHMVLKAEKGNGYQVGDVLYGVPYHVCPTVALHDRAVVVENNKAVTYWNTLSRNRILTV
ncbi:MAG TPA: D-TA family PLP-dependent enzyme [Ohtaekwangia sp.]